MRLLCTMLLFLMTTMSLHAQDPSWYYLFVGTYTNTDKSNGIHVYRFTSDDGEAEPVSVTTDVQNPSYLCVSKDRKNLYAVGELGAGRGAIEAFAFDPDNGKLRFLNRASSHGDHPCYISVDKSGKVVLVGNYSSGTLAAYKTGRDGSFLEPAQVIRHEGSGPNTDRQDGPHVHAVVLSPDNRFLFVPDLGTDKINIYKVDPQRRDPLQPANPAFASVEPGSGPRHIEFHPNGRYAYVINEMSGTVTTFRYEDGKLEALHTVTMLTEGYAGAVGAADIHVSPDGKFLYASNRGDANEIVIWAIDEAGILTYSGRHSTLGKTPRNFAIDPTGNFLLAANQQTNDVVIFRRDRDTGLLEDTGRRIQIDKPVCLKFIAP